MATPATPHTVRFVGSGRTARLPGNTPAISKPWNMAPDQARAMAVGERDGCPLIRFTDQDGTEAEIVARPVPLAAQNPGDEVLVKVDEVDAEGHPVYELAEVWI